MFHGFVLERSNQMIDAIDSIDMRQKGIAEAVTFCCTFDETSNIRHLVFLFFFPSKMRSTVK